MIPNTPSKSVRVMVVEDDPAQRALLTSWLKAEGYRVVAFLNGLDARNHLINHWVDLLILDWDVPGLSGEQILSFVRGRSHSSVPVIFQTVHSSESDIARILDIGADDFLIKPFDRTVLMARIRAVLRRAHASNLNGRKLLIGPCTLDYAKQSLIHGDIAYQLGIKEFDLLWHLAIHLGAVVQRQDLLRLVWGWDAMVQSRSVDMYVSRLRAHLKAAGVNWTIQSVYATGYRLSLGANPDTAQPASPASAQSARPAHSADPASSGNAPAALAEQEQVQAAPKHVKSAASTLEDVWLAGGKPSLK